MKKLLSVILSALFFIGYGCGTVFAKDSVKKEIKGLPEIRIFTDDKKQIKTKDYKEASISVTNCREEFDFTERGKVKVRGNSTADGKDKPLRIKFDNEVNILGLSDGQSYKNWVLLVGYWNLIPDYMGFKLAEAIFEKDYFFSDCVFVNVSVNKKRKGVFLLCEQTEVNKGRIALPENKKKKSGSECAFLYELDNYPEREEDRFVIETDYEEKSITDIRGVTRQLPLDYYSVKNKLYTDDQKLIAEKYIKGVWKIFYEAVENNVLLKFDQDFNVVSAPEYDSAKQAVEAVIDCNSLANMLILEELVRNNDVGAGSFFLAVDLGKKEGVHSRLTFEAPWDFNWAYYDYPNTYDVTFFKGKGLFYACAWQPYVLKDDIDRSNNWYILAMKAPWFAEIVKDKWNKMEQNLVLEETVKRVAAHAKEINYYAAKSPDMVINFVNKRIDYLNSVWGN